MDTQPTGEKKIRFANYRLDHLLGSGGFARVYKGWDLIQEIPVAIKIVDANFSGNANIVATFFDHSAILTSWKRSGH